MDENLAATMNAIDIEGKQLSCSVKDLEKLASDEGCPMHMIESKVYKMDDDDDEDSSGADVSYDDEKCLHKQAKEERMRREYLALALNANRDPIFPGHENKFKKVLDEPEEIYSDIYVEQVYDRVHKRYNKLGSYEQLLANKESPFEEISPGLVYKRRLNTGLGPTATMDSVVMYNCAMWTEGHTDPFDSSWLRHNVIFTDLSYDSILPGLQELLLTCRKGEWCEALIRPAAAFGPLGVQPRIPSSATVFCLLEVVRVVPLSKISRLARQNSDGLDEAGPTFEQLYDASNVARQRGNHFLSVREYKIALQRYKSGIRILEGVTYKDDHEETKANTLLLKLYNNSAKAANMLGEPRLALAACKQASLIDNKEPKTYWQRMSAWKLKGHPERALGQARRAIQLFGNQPHVIKPFQREAEELQRRIQAGESELKDLYRSMGRLLSPRNI